MSDLATVPGTDHDTEAGNAAAVPAISGATNRERHQALTDIRVHDPEANQRAADARAKRSLSGEDGRRMVGRTLLYPADDDVTGAVDTAVSMVR